MSTPVTLAFPRTKYSLSVNIFFFVCQLKLLTLMRVFPLAQRFPVPQHCFKATPLPIQCKKEKKKKKDTNKDLRPLQANAM